MNIGKGKAKAKAVMEKGVGVRFDNVPGVEETKNELKEVVAFLKDFDRIGPFGGGHDEKEQTLNQLLIGLDGFDPQEAPYCSPRSIGPKSSTEHCCVPAASTAKCWLSGLTAPAELRSFAFMQKRSNSSSISTSFRPVGPVSQVPTWPNLVNEAALRATRREADAVNGDDFTGAVGRIVAGIEKRSPLNPHESEVVDS